MRREVCSKLSRSGLLPTPRLDACVAAVACVRLFAPPLFVLVVLSYVRRDARRRFVRLPIGGVQRFWPGGRAPSARQRGVLHASRPAKPRASGAPTDAHGAVPPASRTSRFSSLRLLHGPGVGASHPTGAPSRDRWRSLASSNGRHVCPFER